MVMRIKEPDGKEVEGLSENVPPPWCYKKVYQLPLVTNTVNTLGPNLADVFHSVQVGHADT